MKRKGFWITATLFNLCLVALAGTTLRTKFLYPLKFVDYRNMLSAHSHFAFGGWVTLALMILFIDNLLDENNKQKKVYQVLLWGIHLTSLGMLISFPFKGYALFSIVFSTSFIFFTYGFAWRFVADIRKTPVDRYVKWLSISAMVFLAISSIGPWTLAYILSSKSGGPILYRNSIYTYLHFQYNGFFTLSVLALLFHNKWRQTSERFKKKLAFFSTVICLSVVPALFLSLIWRGPQPALRGIAYGGTVLIVVALLSFIALLFDRESKMRFTHRWARALVILSIFSFLVKMALQTGSVYPPLQNAVFGFRPIIIGYLHLVFLGLVTFYILSNYFEAGIFPNRRFSFFAIGWFASWIIINETILLVQGIGLLMSIAHPYFGFLLWIAAMGLFTGAVLMYISRKLKVES